MPDITISTFPMVFIPRVFTQHFKVLDSSEGPMTFLGQGSFNAAYAYYKDDQRWVIKLPFQSLQNNENLVANDLDSPQRLMRLWNQLNPHTKPAKVISVLFDNGSIQFEIDCLITPFSEGNNLTPSQLVQPLVEGYIKTSRIMLDPLSTGNIKQAPDSNHYYYIDCSMMVLIAPQLLLDDDDPLEKSISSDDNWPTVKNWLLQRLKPTDLVALPTGHINSIIKSLVMFRLLNISLTEPDQLTERVIKFACSLYNKTKLDLDGFDKQNLLQLKMVFNQLLAGDIQVDITYSDLLLFILNNNNDFNAAVSTVVEQPNYHILLTKELRENAQISYLANVPQHNDRKILSKSILNPNDIQLAMAGLKVDNHFYAVLDQKLQTEFRLSFLAKIDHQGHRCLLADVIFEPNNLANAIFAIIENKDLYSLFPSNLKRKSKLKRLSGIDDLEQRQQQGYIMLIIHYQKYNQQQALAYFLSDMLHAKCCEQDNKYFSELVHNQDAFDSYIQIAVFANNSYQLTDRELQSLLSSPPHVEMMKLCATANDFKTIGEHLKALSTQDTKPKSLCC